ncbi:hypothetical protein ZWY2020_039889 [Hordeum vulgare]|nr:hypothetical protein ZWY2020_039889 [Hordeum vulgare]
MGNKKIPTHTKTYHGDVHLREEIWIYVPLKLAEQETLRNAVDVVERLHIPRTVPRSGGNTHLPSFLLFCPYLPSPSSHLRLAPPYYSLSPIYRDLLCLSTSILLNIVLGALKAIALPVNMCRRICGLVLLYLCKYMYRRIIGALHNQ